VSRGDSDLDFWDAINGPDAPQATASCEDCGVDIVPARPAWCDACADKRARWADALEARQQARVTLALPRRKVRA
jgi:hypothetical protein